MVVFTCTCAQQVSFKPGVKERGVMNEQSGESEEREMMGEGIGE